MMFGENEEYSLVVIDFAYLEVIDELLMEKGGRIHNIRPFFSVPDTTDPEICEWDVMYMGWFRSVEEAQQYAIERLAMDPVTEAPETDAPETEAPETNAAADTDAAVDTNGAADTKAPETTAAAFVALKKKD